MALARSFTNTARVQNRRTGLKVMANPVDFEQSNRNFTHPSPEISDMPVYDDGEQLISCFEFTPGERIEFLRTGKIYLGILGTQQPPVWITSFPPSGLEKDDGRNAIHG